MSNLSDAPQEAVNPLQPQRTLTESTRSVVAANHLPLMRAALDNMQVRGVEQGRWYSKARGEFQNMREYFDQEIDDSCMIVYLITCFLAAGLIDVVTFRFWGVFVCMQTGNTIFLAATLADPSSRHDPLSYIKFIVSVVASWAGYFGFNYLHRAPTGLSNSPTLKRWTLTTSFLIQVGLLFVAALIAQVNIFFSDSKERGNPSSLSLHSFGNHYLDLSVIAILSIQAAGQVCLSRVLNMNELSTVALSTIYHDFIADTLSVHKHWANARSPQEFITSQKKQIYRLESIIALSVGALMGGLIFNGPDGLVFALWLTFAWKAVIAGSWCFLRRKTVTEISAEKNEHEQQPQCA